MGRRSFVGSLSEEFFVTDSSQKAKPRMSINFIKVKWIDLEQQTTTDYNIIDFPAAISYNTGTINRQFYLLIFFPVFSLLCESNREIF